MYCINFKKAYRYKCFFEYYVYMIMIVVITITTTIIIENNCAMFVISYLILNQLRPTPR